MKAKTKKLFSTFLALVVALVIGLPGGSVFAAGTAKITIKNVEENATVTAYKIVEKKASGWVAVKSGSIANVEKPTAEEITNLAKDTSDLTAISITDKSGADYVKTGLEPGMYLVLVSKTNSEKVYNPMIVSVNYEYTGGVANAKDGSVDANTEFTIEGNTAYEKSTKPSVSKKVVKNNNASVTNDEAVDHGDTLAVGDVAKFEITTTIPSYSKEYDNDDLKFEIKDTVSEGLNKPQKIVVKANNIALTLNTDYKIEWTGDRTFTIKFTKNYLLSGNSKKDIKVTYESELNNNAKKGFDPNTNEVTLDYSNAPGKNYNSKKDKTYHYTFDIDGDIGGKLGKTGKEIIKVGVDKLTGEVIKKETVTDLGTVENKLQGAKFAIYKANAAGNEPEGDALQTVVTDSNGLMNFKGLDAGKYIIKEIEAPEGYVLDNRNIPVEINATLNTDGTLKSYKVIINGNITTTYSATYDGGTKEVSTTTIDENNSALFQNVKPGGLPSTGGIGTYIFMLIGGALIAMAVLLYTRNRRKYVKQRKRI